MQHEARNRERQREAQERENEREAQERENERQAQMREDQRQAHRAQVRGFWVDWHRLRAQLESEDELESLSGNTIVEDFPTTV